MRQINNKGFSLVELLVVITILAIISVVAYQNFGGATDKAISGRKINDIGTIETALQQFKADNQYYPMPTTHNANTNLWGYNSWAVAYPSNVIRVVYSGKEIGSVNTWSTLGWWKVFGTWSEQIWAKWVISQDDLTKKYLSKDLYDPEIWDISVWSTKMIDYGIGRYVYWIYAQPKAPANWNKQWISGTYYNISTSVKKKDSESYETYIVWDYDDNSCATPTSCPETLIWTASGSSASGTNLTLKNKDLQISSATTLISSQWIPYPIKDFSE